MKSGAGSEPLDFARIVTTPADVLALRRARAAAVPTDVFLKLLSSLEPTPEALRRRRGPSGSEPFRL
ncbi:MAG: hypothetical protein U0599_28165 [Vicinamibacteria bacterium]